MQILETERLILRQLTLDDLQALHRIFSDPITVRFWPAPFTLEATQRWIERSLDHYADFGFGRYALILKTTGELIGDCGILRNEVDGAPENDLGYIIHHPYWRNGYASEAAAACLHDAVEALGLKRLVANMPVAHTGSMRVAEKIGMRRVKTFQNARNRGIDTYVYVYEATR